MNKSSQHSVEYTTNQKDQEKAKLIREVYNYEQPTRA